MFFRHVPSACRLIVCMYKHQHVIHCLAAISPSDPFCRTSCAKKTGLEGGCKESNVRGKPFQRSRWPVRHEKGKGKGKETTVPYPCLLSQRVEPATGRFAPVIHQRQHQIEQDGARAKNAPSLLVRGTVVCGNIPADPLHRGARTSSASRCTSSVLPARER